jgi:hypothetical protein
MSKRSLIIIVLAAILIIAAIVSVKADLEPGSETEPEQKPEPDQVTEKFTGGRKGFYYDRNLKRYVKAKTKSEPGEEKQPSGSIAEGEIIDPGASDEAVNP